MPRPKNVEMPVPLINDADTLPDQVKVNDFYLSYIRFIWDKIKLQRETTDRYFNYYLLLITTPIVAFAAIVGRSDHRLDEQLIGYLCLMLFFIGVCFYCLYVRQRINNITLGDELNEFVQLIKVFDSDYVKRHQSLQINGVLSSPFSADFWVNVIQSIINSFWLCNAILYIKSGIYISESWSNVMAGSFSILSILLHITIRDSCLYRDERRIPLLATIIVTGWYRWKWAMRMYNLWLYRIRRPRKHKKLHPMIKQKFRPEEVFIRPIGPKHSYLKDEILQLAIAQGIAHSTILPTKDNERQQATKNFREALEQEDVEIHALTMPEGSGAIFLSPIRRKGLDGLQLEDLVVAEDLRGRGLGGYLLCQAATLATTRSLSFIAWECERNNPGEKLYLQYGAIMRDDIIPYRLTRKMLLKLMSEEFNPLTSTRVTYEVSPRFSIFRAMTYRNSNTEIDSKESWHGAQIDDLGFIEPYAARCRLIKEFRDLEAKRQLDFVDLVISVANPLHQQLIELFGCEPNTYSGNNSACLWELSGKALKMASEKNKNY